MGVSTDGQICFGIMFDEGFEFPWNGGEDDQDLESWWMEEVCGYKPPFELFTEEGQWIEGMEENKEKMVVLNLLPF